MSGAILHFSHGISDFSSAFIAKINRAFLTIGYLRAAAELNRMGYRAEADKCIRLMNSL